MHQKIFFIVEKLAEGEIFDTIIDYVKAHYKIEPTICSCQEIFEAKTHGGLFLLFLSDEEIKHFFNNHLDSAFHMGIIPNETCPNSIKNYGISKDIFEAVDDAFNEKLLSKVDLLRCNELIVLNRVIIGEMHGMNRLDFDDNSNFEKIKIFFKSLKNIKFKNYILTTVKDQSIKTVASGITIFEHNTKSDASKISDNLSIHDGKLNAFVLAPTSLLSYIWYLISIFIYQKISLLSLPRSLGFIKTSKLTIESNEAIDYMLDSDLLCAKSIELEVLQDALCIHLGRKLEEHALNDDKKIEEEDIVKINALPHGEMNSVLIDGKIPFFKKASDEDFKELFSNLRFNAKFSYVFLTLMVLSTLLATTGLFANSAPVIIGAMILAPLMAPIISLAMGVVRGEGVLLRRSVKTLFIGVSMALLFSCFFTLIVPLEQITPEMKSRVHPNLLDLMVAIFSGIAGAYAYSKEEIAKSLAGVAIAVALVPPLSVSGIGIGLGNFDVLYGSFLLFSTNLVGITLSAAITFIILGFAPVKKAKKGIFYTSLMMVLIAIPLGVSFFAMVEKNRYFTELKTLRVLDLGTQEVELILVNIENKKEVIIVDIEAVSRKPLSPEDYITIKANYDGRVDKKIILKIIPEVIVQ